MRKLEHRVGPRLLGAIAQLRKRAIAVGCVTYVRPFWIKRRLVEFLDGIAGTKLSLNFRN
jgi:hypothetical protein